MPKRKPWKRMAEVLARHCTALGCPAHCARGLGVRECAVVRLTGEDRVEESVICWLAWAEREALQT